MHAIYIYVYICKYITPHIAHTYYMHTTYTCYIWTTCTHNTHVSHAYHTCCTHNIYKHNTHATWTIHTCYTYHIITCILHTHTTSIPHFIPLHTTPIPQTTNNSALPNTIHAKCMVSTYMYTHTHTHTHTYISHHTYHIILHAYNKYMLHMSHMHT